MIYTINNCIRAFGYTNFDNLIADMDSVDNLKAYVIANGYADIAVGEDTELLLVDVNGNTWHTGCYGAKLEPGPGPEPGPDPGPGPEPGPDPDPEPEPERDYLCFTSTGDSTVAMTQNGTPDTSSGKVIQYKLNNGQWQTWDLSNVTLSDGDKMYLKSDDEIPVCESSDIYKQFVMTGSIAASGNIMSLLNFSTTLTNYAFCNMFCRCTSLTTAPKLPATTLSDHCYYNMFTECTSLTTAPELPATTLVASCYLCMFKDCTSLTAAPELPATKLAKSCYNQMFQGCTSLTTAPELPATTLETTCYAQMFNGCTSLTQASALHATTLADQCYISMFRDCTALTTAPALPATTLAQSCYMQMFYNCTSLTTAPELPATTLAASCYYYMFQGCSSLTTAPVLPATTLIQSCYKQMFFGCSNLNYVKALFTNISTEEPLTNWLYNVSPTGTFDKSKDATWTNEQAGIPEGWTILVEGVVPPEPEKPYLCFTSTGDSTVAMTQTGTPNTSANKVIQYKLNDGQWQNWDLSAVTLSDGEKMYLKSDDEIPVSEQNKIYKQFKMTGSIAATGNIMSLLNFSGILTNYAFYKLFDTCASLTTTPELPATTLAENCYTYMFSDCTSLTQAPELPATTLANSCYYGMFWGCTSLTQATALPATTLTTNCYKSMFNSCSLTTAPELPATTLANGCYRAMFQKCTSLTSVPELPATTLSEECYYGMLLGCTSLTQAPELPATTLASRCYYGMFEGCTSLTTAPALPATTLVNECYLCMFKGCTSIVQAPELPATTLERNCYKQMFDGCTKLNYVKAMFTDISAEYCLSYWLDNVSPTGTFIKSKRATWTNADAKIPSGWTVEVEKDYLCFTSTGDSTVAMKQNGTPITTGKVIQYKINNGQWQRWNMSAVSLYDGDKMYLKSDDTIPISEANSIYKQFKMTGSIAATGNIMSLFNFSNTLVIYAFYRLFEGCTSLTTAPELPVTALTDSCYEYMFKGCSSLTTAPELPAYSLRQYCYNYMFYDCSKLNYVKAMFTTDEMLYRYTDGWLYNVSSTGTFVKSKSATWTNKDAGIPSGWTVQTA